MKSRKLADRLAAAEQAAGKYTMTFTDTRTGRPIRVPIADALGVMVDKCPPESLAKIARADYDAETSMLGRTVVGMAQYHAEHGHHPYYDLPDDESEPECDSTPAPPPEIQLVPEPQPEPEPEPEVESDPVPEPAPELTVRQPIYERFRPS